MKENIEKLKEKISLELKDVTDLNDYMRLKVEYLGKKGKVPELANFIKTLDKTERKDAGMLLNEFKKHINDILESTKERLEEEALNQKIQSEWLDITLPGTRVNVGTTHPLTKVIDEIEELFISMGYDVVEGPEIESDLYNLELWMLIWKRDLLE